jgi:hypothetical protein
MRRLRQHRLTGSVRRLLGAAMLAAAATAVVVTTAAGAAAASGVGVNLNLGALGVSLNLPTPSLPVTLPSSGAPSSSGPLLRTTLPPVCPTNCATSDTGGSGGPSPHSTGGNTGFTTAPAPGVGRGGSVPVTVAAGGSSTTTAPGGPRAFAGLAVSPPPPVEPLTPLAGISFGQAPYLWPLLVVLDLVALVAVVMLVRRTWSPNSDAD